MEQVGVRIGAVWMLWPPGDSGATEEDLECSMVSLFRQRPGSAQKIEEWMERWSQESSRDVPESFRRLCKQAHKAAHQNPP